jgi:hypothetical protein
MYWNVGNLLLCTGMLAICYALECWQFVMHWNVGNCTTKRTNINKCYTADLICVIICTSWAPGETVLQYQHSTSIIFPCTWSQNFIIWLKSSREPRFELSTSGQFNTKAVSTSDWQQALNISVSGGDLNNWIKTADYNRNHIGLRLSLDTFTALQELLALWPLANNP